MHFRLQGRTNLTIITVLMTASASVIAPAANATSSFSAVSIQTDTPLVAAIDGRSMSTAAASCWEIKQLDPRSTDGVYWLQTPTLTAPEQFYCDQTTDGGGWVLIGRGREGWQYNSEGKGTTAEVRTKVTGTAAFSTKQLSAEIVKGLMNGGKVDDLADGIRVRRATNKAGSTWQEMRMKFTPGKVTTWTWALGAQIPIDSFSFNGAAGSGGTTYGFGSSGANYFTTSIQDSATNYQAGMGFKVAGDTSASSYIWSKSNGSTPGLPFSQMYIRPKLTTDPSAYPAASAEASPAIPLPAIVTDRVLSQEWGVTGLANGDPGELSIEVAAFAQVGNVMYVGGNFTHVLKNGAAATKQAQSFLAAFDVNTGAWIDTFRPVFNKQVKSLYALPNGQLLVGGQFTKVNGVNQAGIVALDPKTGANSTTYQIGAYLANESDLNVKTFARQGDWLYIGGRFSALWGGSIPLANKSAAGNAGRVNINTGEPDRSWNPRMNGTVASISPAAAGDRVNLAGFFKKSDTTDTDAAAILSTAGTSPVAVIKWSPTYAHATHYQQSVLETHGNIFLAGAQHQLAVYDRTTLAQKTTGISLAGGDFQVSAEQDGVVYSGNHSVHFFYTGATTYWYKPSGIGPWTDVHKTCFTGAWDSTTGLIRPEFDPILKGRRDNGTWALTFDSNGTMWMGGDFVTAVGTSGKNQWVGGFVRFAKRDDVTPATPASAALSADTLTWPAATDDRAGAVGYEVLVNGRVRYTTSSTSQAITGTAPGDLISVRAIDATGNRSASTVPLKAGDVPPPPPAADTLVAENAAWRYAITPATSEWRNPSFSDSSWQSVTAPVGYGSTPLGTTLNPDAVAPRALSHSFRTTFSVTDPAAIAGVALTTVADDGVAIFVNGKEVLRSNLPDGALTPSTYAVKAVKAATAAAAPVVVNIPSAYLVAGTNTITAETHANYKATDDLTFWASVTSIKEGSGVTFIPAPPENRSVLASGASWLVRTAAGAPAEGWNGSDFEPTNEFTPAVTPIGYGSAGLATTLTPVAAANRPLTSYYRTTVTIDPAQPGDLALTTYADDGIAVYVNGTEVTRSNLPTGPLTFGTYAKTAPNTANARKTPIQVTIPRDLLVAGENVIAAEVHLNYRASTTMSFDLSITR